MNQVSAVTVEETMAFAAKESAMRRTLGLTFMSMLVAAVSAAAQPNPSGAITQPHAEEVTPGSRLAPTHFARTALAHQWRASKLIGLDVYGTDDEKIGDVREILLDRDGGQLVVISVGGFLGIASREVAVPFKAVDWRYGERPKPADRSTAPSSSPAAEPDASPRKTVDTTRRGYPDFAFLRATRETLRSAPEFSYGGDAPSSAGDRAPPTR
jgi:hypothetical protein